MRQDVALDGEGESLGLVRFGGVDERTPAPAREASSMAMLNPEGVNMSTSFGMSPIVEISAGSMP